MKMMAGTKPEEVIEEINVYRRELITPILYSDKEYVQRWLSQECRENTYMEKGKVYETKKGDKVRSKSEAMIADMYYELGIPYRYEYPCELGNGQYRFPDFALLKMPERKIVYHEHFGLIEDEGYRRSCIEKIQQYSKAGVYIGKNLIITVETDYAKLDIAEIRKMVTELFLGEDA